MYLHVAQMSWHLIFEFLIFFNLSLCLLNTPCTIKFKLISFQICLYIQLKFKSLNMKLNKLLESKQSIRIGKRIDFMIDEHNAICRQLNDLNNFWKFYLQVIICFFLLVEWFFLYEVCFDSNLLIFNKMLLCFWLMFITSLLCCFIFIIYIASAEVTNFFI